MNEDPIYVESIKTESGTFEGIWNYFEIQRGNLYEELGESLDVALTYLVRNDTNGRYSIEIGKQMLEKQDQLVDKQVQMLANQEIQISEQKMTNQEIQDMRSDLKDSLHTKYQYIEQQLHEIQTILKNVV